jgi:hypothetical protein
MIDHPASRMAFSGEGFAVKAVHQKAGRGHTAMALFGGDGC